MTVPNTIPDYIIIGGGLCGCVLASRLREDNPSLRILLIEAGPDSRGHPLFTGPNGSFAFPARQSEIDWHFRTTPQKNLDGRQYNVSAGKILSGSTVLNLAAWTRGSRVDYDHWAEVVGDQRWSYEGLLPCFRRTERHWDPDVDQQQHGLEGPMHVTSISASDPGRIYPLRGLVRKAWESVGVKHIPDGNGGTPLGLFEGTENWHDGKRQAARDAYNLDGVEIMVDSTVCRVLIEEQDGMKKAVGVELLDGRPILASKEVIISSGAIATPKLLMLSGIGPEAQLKRHLIPVTLDAPGVGQNYHDHFAVRQYWQLRNPEAGLAAGHPKWTNPAFAKGVPYDWLTVTQTPLEELRGALATDGKSKLNEHLLHPETGHIETIFVYFALGGGNSSLPVFPVDGKHVATLTVGMLPTSRGSVELASADPLVPPIVNPNDYDTEADKVSLRAGIRQVLRLMFATPEGKEMVVGNAILSDVPSLTLDSTDGEIDAYARRVGATTFHPAGTASMGSVVDSDLKVFGIEGLRVVDASVLPVPIAAHLQVPLYALAEQAADIIMGK